MNRGDSVRIIGGGVAGCVAALVCEEEGLRPQLVSSQQPGQATRVAAGLMNPVSGPRLAVIPNARRLLDAAVRFYRIWETRLQTSLLQPLLIERRLRSEEERFHASKRRASGELEEWVEAWLPDAVLLRGYRLDTDRLLASVQARLEKSHAWIESNQDPRSPRIEERWIWATGWRASVEGPFTWVPFAPVKGQCVESAWMNPPERALLDRHFWHVPIGDGKLRSGATFEREFSHLEPDLGQARPIRLAALQAFGPTSGEPRLLAGVRPVTQDRNPVVGSHPEWREHWILNGLGTRGAIMAPALAGQLVATLQGADAIDSAYGLKRFSHRYPVA